MISKVKGTYTELEQENKKMKEEIKELKDTIAQLKNQNINFNQGNFIFQSNQDFQSMKKTIIIDKENEGDKIEEKIKILKQIFEQTKKNWNKILSDILAFKREMETIKNQMKNDFEKIKIEYQEVLKKTLERQYNNKLKLELKKINDYFDKKFEEKFRKMVERSKKQFEKIYENNKDNEIKQKEGYSFKCLNSGELKAVINEGDDQAKITITLKNNGSKAWEKGDTVLCYNRQSKISGEDNYLNPQNPGEENSYDIIFKSLKDKKPGEYPFILEVYIGRDPIGEQIPGKLIIKKEK